MITNSNRRKGPKRFNFYPVSVSPKTNCITNNIIEYINNDRQLIFQEYGKSIEDEKKIKHQLNQLIANHEYPKSSIERTLRLKYINKQLEMNLESRQLLDYYICKIENVILNDRLKTYNQMSKNSSESEKLELIEIQRLKEEVEEYVLDSINRNKPVVKREEMDEIEDESNIEFENYMLQVVEKSLANKANATNTLAENA